MGLMGLGLGSRGPRPLRPCTYGAYTIKLLQNTTFALTIKTRLPWVNLTAIGSIYLV